MAKSFKLDRDLTSKVTGTVDWRISESLGLKSGFESPNLDRPGRLPHQQGLCEARLGCRDGSPQLGGPGP